MGGAMINLGSGAGEVRRYELARHWLEECRDFCAARDLDYHHGYALSWLARVELEQGDWNRAGTLAEPLLDSGDPIARMNALTVTARLRSRRGEPGAGPLLDAGRGSWPAAPATCNGCGRWPPRGRRPPG